ncbi:hypothetical protein D3C73_1512290 [compost metagenome]
MMVTVIMPVMAKGVTIRNNTPYGDKPSITADSSNSLGMLPIKLARINMVKGTLVTA